MLIDHAEPEPVRIARAGDLLLARADDQLAVVGPVIAHDAFDQGRLAGAVLAEQRMHGAGHHAQRHVVERDEVAEALRDVQRLDAEAAPSAQTRAHGSAATSAAERDTAPNTPPCILTILIAARWLPWSVAPQQSSSSKHSKPRSLASRMVVCTHTSVVMPVRMMLSMPRWRRISSRSVAQNDPLPGLSMTISPCAGASSGMISQPGSPRTRMRPHGPGPPIPAPMRRERQRLLAGRSARSG